MMKIVQLLKLTFLIAVISFLLSCSSSNDPIKIGAILPLSGSASRHAAIAEGIELAIDEINHYGGINGHPLEMMLLDNETHPETAKRAFAELETDYRPHIYISSTSFISLTLAPLAEKASVAFTGLIAASPKLTVNRDWIFRYYPSISEVTRPILNILEDNGIKQLGVIHLNDSIGNALYTKLKNRFEATGGEIFSQSFDVTAENNNFSKQVAALSHLQAIYIVGYEGHTAAALKELYRVGYKGLKLSGSGAANLPRNSPELDEVYIAVPNIYDSHNIRVERVGKRYQSRFRKTFNFPAALGYDFVIMLNTLIQHQQVITRESIQQALAGQISHSGIFGNINKSAGVHDIAFPMFKSQVINGRLVLLQ